MKRSTASTIFKTVVFAGAMLGTSAGCGKKAAPNAPKAEAKQAEPPKDGDAAANGGEGEDGRPRGTNEEDPEGGGEGRGFILS
ncbi:MAG: hypothetical protein KF773_28545 [Deltaproteobacteria bacterium]|nr:hypothetical protein [Deltaproteobacteria bacterium]MCW5801846.1 hypothetical protein [Deltaproteobacteria bacterium]